MLPPEPDVLIARQAFVDAQALLTGSVMNIGYFAVGWYGTSVSDERGSFALVNPAGPLASLVGDFVQVTVAPRQVNVFVIGAYGDLNCDLALTRRAYLGLSLLAVEPVQALVARLA